MSAFPVRELPIISIGGSEAPEDSIGPTSRVHITSILAKSGYTDLKPEHPHLARLCFPAPQDSLGEDPALQVLPHLDKPDQITLTTPTQAILCLFHTNGGRHGLLLQRELLHLVWEQPAGLPQIEECALAAGLRKAQSILGPLELSQARGRALRSLGNFDSRLPI